MKVERKVTLADEEKAWSERPAGSSISFTQLTIPCDLRLKFRRQRVKVASPLSIGLLYGRALHLGAENYLRGAAKTPAQAIKAALRGLDEEIAKAERGPGVRWDDAFEVNLDGSISLQGNNFARLPSVEVCRFWLERQLALWLLIYGRKLNVRYSEHRLFVPLSPQPGWKSPWSVESWLDLVEMDEAGDYGITDLKSAASRWDAGDVQKFSKQAMLYMGAAEHEWERPPARPFEFHILPRAKAALGALEITRTWALGDAEQEDPWPTMVMAELQIRTGGPVKTKTVTEGKGKAAVKQVVNVTDEEGRPVREWTLEDALQVVEIAYDVAQMNIYIKGVIRPKIAAIEAGAFVASPAGWHCSRKFCDYWDHCAFGEGKAL